MLQTDDLFLGAFGLVRGGELGASRCAARTGAGSRSSRSPAPGSTKRYGTTTVARLSWTCGF